MIETYVGDVIAAGDDEFVKESMITGRYFKAKEGKFYSFTFAAINIKREGKSYILNNENYANSIQPLSSYCTFLRAAVGFL